MKRRMVTLPDDVADELEEMSRLRNRTLSETVCDVLKQGLESSKQHDYSIIGIVSDGSKPHGEDLDAVLAEYWAEDLEAGTDN